MKIREACKRIVQWILVVSLAVPAGVLAQGSTPGAPEKSAQLSKEELDQMLAPIALYPDALLAQVLMASTYPLEVVGAARFVNENKNLKGDQLEAALLKKDWDPSVKSLVPFPAVLSMMNDKLDWTQKLGNTFLAQQKDVMDAVQRLRAKAQASGNLKTSKEQIVIVEREIIRIEPATQVIYVPTYNPTVVYGVWPYPAYPPYPYYPPGYVAGVGVMSFAFGVAVGASYGGFHWGHGDVTINRNINVNRQTANINNINRPAEGGTGKWQHNPEHRKGVQYPNQATAQQYSRSGDARAQGQQNLSSRGYGQAGPSVQPQGAQRTREPAAFSGAGSGSNERLASARGQSSRWGGGASRAGGFAGGASRGRGGRRR